MKSEMKMATKVGLMLSAILFLMLATAQAEAQYVKPYQSNVPIYSGGGFSSGPSYVTPVTPPSVQPYQSHVPIYTPGSNVDYSSHLPDTYKRDAEQQRYNQQLEYEKKKAADDARRREIQTNRAESANRSLLRPKRNDQPDHSWSLLVD